MNVIGCVRVKNGEKYLDRWMADMLGFCNSVCILDDGSDDSTPDLIRKWAKHASRVFARFQRGLPRDGGRDCNTLYDMVASLKPDWIFAPDIDEFIEPQDASIFPQLTSIEQDDVLGWTFPFFYFWDLETQYRTDGDYANCHVIRLFRFMPDLRPPNRVAHTQMCPDELDRRRIRPAPIRMVHYGYMEEAERKRKFGFYTNRDEDPLKAGAGVKNYDHIVASAALSPYISDRASWISEQGKITKGL